MPMSTRSRFLPSLAMALGLALTTVAPLAVPAAAKTTAWEPAKTYALLVGILEWQSKDLASFPKENRQDRALERQLLANGVPRDHLVFLEDRKATGEAIRT